MVKQSYAEIDGSFPAGLQMHSLELILLMPVDGLCASSCMTDIIASAGSTGYLESIITDLHCACVIYSLVDEICRRALNLCLTSECNKTAWGK